MRFLVVLLVLLGGCGMPDEPAVDKMARATAAEVAHDVGTHLAGIGPGLYGSAGVSYLSAELERRGATVLGTHSADSAENGRLQARVDARFDFPNVTPEDRNPPVCLRFEVRWVYGGDYVTYDGIDCP